MQNDDDNRLEDGKLRTLIDTLMAFSDLASKLIDAGYEKYKSDQKAVLSEADKNLLARYASIMNKVAHEINEEPEHRKQYGKWYLEVNTNVLEVIKDCLWIRDDALNLNKPGNTVYAEKLAEEQMFEEFKNRRKPGM